MGHRALVAYERPDDLFNAHYSWWGATDLHLRTDITPETPLGGDPAEPAFVGPFTSMLAEATDGSEYDLEGEATTAQDIHDIRPDPFMAGIDMPTVLTDAWQQAAFEALYVVSYDEDDVIGTIQAFRPFTVIGDGSVFYDARWVGDEPVSDSHDRGWLRGRRDTYQECIQTDLLTDAEARDRLLVALLDRFEQRLDQKVLAISPAIGHEHRKAHPEAFLHLDGRGRVLGEMYPTGISEPAPWELPAAFPAVKTDTGTTIELPSTPM